MHSGVKITVNEQNVQGPNVLPNGENIGQSQKRVSTKFRNMHLMVKNSVGFNVTERPCPETGKVYILQ